MLAAQMPKNKLDRAETESEIMRVRSWAEDQCGIPEGSMRGYRSPYLDTNPVVRQVCDFIRASDTTSKPPTKRGRAVSALGSEHSQASLF
jgi:peptidoglycan/xylan/chitin deacetylase (PgdA/CDA1 family)